MKDYEAAFPGVGGGGGGHLYSTYAWRGSGGPAKGVLARIGEIGEVHL